VVRPQDRARLEISIAVKDSGNSLSLPGTPDSGRPPLTRCNPGSWRPERTSFEQVAKESTRREWNRGRSGVPNVLLSDCQCSSGDAMVSESRPPPSQLGSAKREGAKAETPDAMALVL
jgi:hypothetical protein